MIGLRATAALLGILLCPARACNGAASFCDLPLTKAAFATTHNSGAFKLDIPELVKEDIPGVNVNDALKCYYENHDMDFVQQLNFGIRGFNLDLCLDEDHPGIYFNCHGNPPGMGLDFSKDLDRFVDFLALHTEEVVVLTAGNFKLGLNAGKQWEDLIGSKFGGQCIELNEGTNVSQWEPRSHTSCLVVRSRPSDNVTLAALVNNNLRVVVWPEGWKFQSWVHSTYDPTVNPGATSSSLMKDFNKYATGEKPQGGLNRSSSLVLNIIGAPKLPSTAKLNKCKDIFCKTAAATDMVDEIELSCIKTMSRRFNGYLLQGDAASHEFFTDDTCPQYDCGCLGYKSPIEVLHQKLLKMGHAVHLISVDYPEKGTNSDVAHVARRLNEATVRYFNAEDELGAEWWSCHFNMVAGVAVGCGLVLLCAVCCLLARYGSCFRRQREAYQKRVKAREEGRERGLEEARLQMGRDGGHGMANPNYGLQGTMPQQMSHGGMVHPGYGMQGNMPQMNYGGMAHPMYSMQGAAVQGTVPQQIPPGMVVAPPAGFQKFVDTE